MQDATERYGSVRYWASKSHVGCVVDAQAKIIDEFSVSHTAAGLQALVQHFTRAGVKRVAIERPERPGGRGAAGEWPCRSARLITLDQSVAHALQPGWQQG